jgi:hypothetical protein
MTMVDRPPCAAEEVLVMRPSRARHFCHYGGRHASIACRSRSDRAPLAAAGLQPAAAISRAREDSLKYFLASPVYTQ